MMDLKVLAAQDNPFLALAPATLPAVAKLLRLNGREESRRGERDAEVIRYLTG